MPLILLSQNGYIKGVVLDINNNPIENVNISSESNVGATTNSNGFYSIEVKASNNVNITFSHVNFKSVSFLVNLKTNEVYEFYPVMDINIEQIEEIVLNSNKRAELKNIITIDPQIIRTIKGAQPGIENLLKTLPGVNISNELSTQYSVRGGNFDENLVYVNGIEIYRPFLVRSGQQEGLSFVNSKLIKNINFSAGGFQSKYGDKLSSVLDIEYKNPNGNNLSGNLNLLGGNITSENISKNAKISNILGVRYRDNSLLVNSRETLTNYNPKFIDIQNFLTANINEKFSFNFLSYMSVNNYNYKPESRQTNFGTLDDPTALIVYYQGQEKDKYQTFFGAVKLNFKATDYTELSLITSAFQTSEKEYFDILAQYRLGEVNNNIGDEDLGDVEFSEGIGSQLNHGRNNLNAIIYNIEHKGSFKKNKNNLEWSLKLTKEDIKDRIVEWEVIDSTGYSIDPPFFESLGDQPYTANEGPIVPYQNIRKTNNTNTNRIQSFIQWSKNFNLGSTKVYSNAGVRLHGWSIDKQKINFVFSPRFQVGIKPDWEKDMIFKLSGGVYQQPPFYRELRDYNGDINYDVKAQKSIQLVASNEYSYMLWNRPFKLTSELYYKNMSNINPYTIDNVRIRYLANNNAKAYAYGLDVRLNGEFIKGTESWFSFGYLNTKENIDNQGYIPRPSDQRLKFGILFQDYIPNIPDLKMYLNLVYNSGVPGGAPSYANAYDYQNRLPDYKRVDLGISYVIVGGEKDYKKGWKKNFSGLNIGLEIFNMFDIQNSITNTWVRDVYSKRQYSIPNYLTPRILNLTIDIKL
ncbi:carboxypeptidase-like regulatory domain-containing protein [Flavobacteriaceae bacterium]|nr:carboxypeptidase-like regulatory domain-containing protein [Flavobacteriaceae bacterium]MDC1321475.1 carboxypeptidase-like regulatory domain-containing protein [Flavobacteriaceae bacterium]